MRSEKDFKLKYVFDSSMLIKGCPVDYSEIDVNLCIGEICIFGDRFATDRLCEFMLGMSNALKALASGKLFLHAMNFGQSATLTFIAISSCMVEVKTNFYSGNRIVGSILSLRDALISFVDEIIDLSIENEVNLVGDDHKEVENSKTYFRELRSGLLAIDL